MSKFIIIIIGMMGVTYIPRLLPFVMVSKKDMPLFLKRFLGFIPATALGAMIIPGVFTATPSVSYAAVFGALFAGIYSWFKGGLTIPVLGSIGVVFIIIMISIY